MWSSCMRMKKFCFFMTLTLKATIHILGVPKNSVINFREFISSVDKDSVKYFFDKALEVIKNFGLDKSGYRLITNDGENANQEVAHFHIHILGGENLGGLR